MIERPQEVNGPRERRQHLPYRHSARGCQRGAPISLRLTASAHLTHAQPWRKWNIGFMQRFSPNIQEHQVLYLLIKGFA